MKNYKEEIIGIQENNFTELNETKEILINNLKNKFENKEVLTEELKNKLLILNQDIFLLKNKIEELNYEILIQKFNFTDEDKLVLHEFNQRNEYETEIKEFILNKFILENY